MTYFGFLIAFIGIPIAILLILTRLDERGGRLLAGFSGGKAVALGIGLHVLLAVAYTTPWDNYLVATGVWYYNPELISGVLLGWVPLEEYTFFVLEPVLTGLWWWILARRTRAEGDFSGRKALRILSTAILGLIWLGSLAILAFEWEAGTYLALILGWALPAIGLQLAFGVDILWHHRKLLLLAVLPLFLYLSAADSVAISAGTWTIDPGQSTGLFVGPLPVEEAVFFLITVVLISFGLTLSLAEASRPRWASIVSKWAARGGYIPSRFQDRFTGWESE